MKKVIEVAGLTKTYVQKPVLKQLNFSVDRGGDRSPFGKKWCWEIHSVKCFATNDHKG